MEQGASVLITFLCNVLYEYFRRYVGITISTLDYFPERANRSVVNSRHSNARTTATDCY